MCDSLCGPLRHRHRTSGVLLKASNRSARQPCNCRLPAYPALAISTLAPAVIGIATTILSAVLVWTIKSGDPFKKGSATCLKVLGILFVVQAATSFYAGSLETSVSMFGGEGPSAPKRSLHHSTGPLWFSASSCSCFPSSSCTPESCTSTPTRLRKETPCP